VTGSSGNLPTWKKGNIRSDYLTKISEIFNVSTDYLLGRTDSPTPQFLDVPPVLNDVWIAFNEKGINVDELTQAKVDKIAEYTKFVLSQPD